jgi:hypothetical protein
MTDSMLQKEMQTASFNKQAGTNRSKVINSEQPTENTDREVNLIDQRAFQMDSQGMLSRGDSKSTQKRITGQGPVTGQFGTKEEAVPDHTQVKQVDHFQAG